MTIVSLREAFVFGVLGHGQQLVESSVSSFYGTAAGLHPDPRRSAVIDAIEMGEGSKV